MEAAVPTVIRVAMGYGGVFSGDRALGAHQDEEADDHQDQPGVEPEGADPHPDSGREGGDLADQDDRTGRYPAREPGADGLQELVGELSTRSEEFHRRSRAHDVRTTHGTGVTHFHHHVVGDLELAYESLDLRAEPGLTLTIYAAEPSSPAAHALALLASWTATERQSST